MNFLKIITLALLPLFSIAQKSKVQAAWRSLNDYESTLNENPDVAYLIKAKENIDLALANDETKNQAKAHAYKTRIMYGIYQYNLKQEIKKLEATVTDKNVLREKSFAITPFAEFNEALDVVTKLKTVDAKYFEKTLGPNKVEADLTEDDLKLYNTANQMRVDASNIAVAKYKAKEFNDAAEFFNKSANLNMLMSGKKDSTSYYNACICAQKAKNTDKVILYNTDMINQNIGTTYNYQILYETYIAKKDSAQAENILKKGIERFPNNMDLLNEETKLFIHKGNQQQAILNLNKALAKDSTNFSLQFVLGNLYNTLANPKTPAGKDTTKPANYEELILKAEEHYTKTVDLKPADKETQFNVFYNLGALYYNHGVTLYNKSMEKATLVDLAKKQKEYEQKSAEQYKKAVPYFEQALAVKADDLSTLTALRKLYYLTGNETKGNELGVKIKSLNK